MHESGVEQRLNPAPSQRCGAWASRGWRAPVERWRTLEGQHRQFAKGAGMTTIQKWTGREARLLREAMRMSVRDFAGRLGVSARAVSKWEAGGERMVPRPDSQSILDTVLENSPSNARIRFEQLLGGRADRHGELEVPSGQIAILPNAEGSALRDNPGSRSAPPSVFSDDGEAVEDVFGVLSRIQKLHRGMVHPEVIRQLDDNARRVVTQYEAQNHSTLVPVLLKQRALVEEILGECSHPSQQQKLY